jgi:hypothetical protein
MSEPGDEFATWDAAYVLGALSPADRRRFEHHLEDCARCRESVAELAGVPGMLALVPRDTALAMLDDEPQNDPAPADLLPRLAAATQRRRRRGVWISVGAAVAAAAAAVAIAVPVTLAGSTDSGGSSGTTPTAQAEPVASRSMDKLVATPLSAEVELFADPSGGTRIDMVCRYDETGRSYTGEYSLWVGTSDGGQSHAATWKASPGDTVTESAVLDVPPSDITHVDIRSTATDQVLLTTVI